MNLKYPDCKKSIKNFKWKLKFLHFVITEIEILFPITVFSLTRKKNKTSLRCHPQHSRPRSSRKKKRMFFRKSFIVASKRAHGCCRWRRAQFPRRHSIFYSSMEEKIQFVGGVLYSIFSIYIAVGYGGSSKTQRFLKKTDKLWG